MPDGLLCRSHPHHYCNQSQSCSKKLDTNKFVPGLKVKSWIAIEKNETAMVNALIQHGPLSIIFNAGQLQFYKYGIWNPPDCNNIHLNHAVLLVGYGTQRGALGKKPYWLVKNSWGVKWGTDGYFKLGVSSTSASFCNEASSFLLSQ